MKKAAPFLILIAGILWGCLGLVTRILNAHDLSAMEIVCLRATVTAASMGIILLITDRRLFRIGLKDLWCFLGTGICSIVFFNFCYFTSIGMSSLSVAAVLLYTAPAIVMILSYFLFGEKLTPVKGISLVITFVGCLLVTGVLTDPGNVTIGGILFGLGSGLGYALYSIFSRFALDRGYHTFTITFYTFLFAAIATCFLTDTKKIAVSVTSDLSVFCLVVLALGLLGTVIPYLSYTKGLSHTENGRASIIASIEPVTASIMGVAVYHESLSFSSLIGVIMVIGALILCNLPIGSGKIPGRRS